MHFAYLTVTCILSPCLCCKHAFRTYRADEYKGSSDAQLQGMACSCCVVAELKHLRNVETWFFCPQTFLNLDFQCRDDVCELE